LPHSIRKVIAFVLSGGGSLGAVQAGMLRALYERSIAPDLIVGTSVGRGQRCTTVALLGRLEPHAH
jgi:predicted acylesterase/phospholipase RssA